MLLEQALSHMPLIAILRGISPAMAVPVASILHEEGFQVIEVPLNSPDPFLSIEKLVAAFGATALIGAGTVTDPADVGRLADIGAKLVVAPNCDTRVIKEGKAHKLCVLPGVATPSEAFTALLAGADGLKLFPAEAIGPAGLRAWKTTLPQGTRLIPVGGIVPETINAWHQAGAAAFGIGSTLYQPDLELLKLRLRARAFVTAVGKELQA